MVNVYVQKETSQGLKEKVSADISVSEAVALLEKIQIDYKRDDVECRFINNGKTLVCNFPESSTFKVTYSILASS